MKKNIFFFCLLLLCMQVVSAQLTKGNWLVGGNANYSSDKQTVPNTLQSSSKSFAVLPNIGFFIKDKFAVGLAPGIAYVQSKNGPTKVSVTSYIIGPVVRYYFLNVENTTNIFIQGKAGYSSNHFNNGPNNKSSTSNVTYSLDAGPVIYFNSSVGLEFTLGWSYNKVTTDKSYLNSLKLGIGFQIHLQK